ncbi:hypothetical protein [Actinomycetospora atypica]|uniref:Pilus assembly protein CpaF n=1 Tax=Actinomycetospora atypica TaxID=1290095 RepID=A0ABV9YVP7_9PSEU
MHANSPREVPARLEALAALGGMSPAALRSQMVAAIQVVLHVRRLPEGRRVLEGVGVVRRGDGDAVVVVPAWGRVEGWAVGRADLGAMLAERDVAAPWEAPVVPVAAGPVGHAEAAEVPVLRGGVASLRGVPA